MRTIALPLAWYSLAPRAPGKLSAMMSPLIEKPVNSSTVSGMVRRRCIMVHWLGSTSAAPPAPTAVPDLFAGAVRPILKTHCAPCHEPGGRLYDRLPFDDARVVSSHSPGILRRLKGEDRAAFEQWLATLRPAN